MSLNVMSVKNIRKWNKETIDRHIDRPYYQCRNMKELKNIVKSKKKRDLILEMVDRLVETFDPQHVILFGSYARGTPNKNSDVDLMVVFSGNIHHFNKTIEIKTTLRCFPLKYDLVVASRRTIGKYACVKSSVYNMAISEGLHLYEKNYDLAIYWLKNAKESLKWAQKDNSLNGAISVVVKSIRAAIIVEGMDLPNTKYLEEEYAYVPRSWKIGKFYNDLKTTIWTGSSEKGLKIALDFYNVIFNEFKSRKIL